MAQLQTLVVPESLRHSTATRGSCGYLAQVGFSGFQQVYLQRTGEWGADVDPEKRKARA